MYYLQFVFHGISVNSNEVLLDGSECPFRIDAEAQLSSEKLAPVASLNKVNYIGFQVGLFLELFFWLEVGNYISGVWDNMSPYHAYILVVYINSYIGLHTKI